MNFIKKICEKRKITKQLIKTYELGGFATIEDSLAKLCKEHEDIAIYFFKYFNKSYENGDEFFRDIMQSQKIVISSKILRESINNKHIVTYLAYYKDRLTKEQIFSILNENFSSYYNSYTENLYTIMRYVLGREYYNIINSLIIKYPTYQSACDIGRAIVLSENYSDMMIDAMITTNNLEEMNNLRVAMKIRHVDIPKKLNDKIEELEKKQAEEYRKITEEIDKEKYYYKPEDKVIDDKEIEKQKRKLNQSQEKLQASINNL